PAEGIEPTRSCDHWILSPARLPIPPRRRREREATKLGPKLKHEPRRFLNRAMLRRSRPLAVSEQSAASAQCSSRSAHSPPPPCYGCPGASALWACCSSCWALTLWTFELPGAELPVSSTSTQVPPIWLPVRAGTQTMCFPLFAAVAACDDGAGFKSKFNCVRPSALVFVLLIEA